jgi:hypothetical protein
MVFVNLSDLNFTSYLLDIGIIKQEVNKMKYDNIKHQALTVRRRRLVRSLSSVSTSPPCSSAPPKN